MRKHEGHKRKNEEHKMKLGVHKHEIFNFWKKCHQKKYRFSYQNLYQKVQPNNRAKGVAHKGPKIEPTLHNNWIICPTE